MNSWNSSRPVFETDVRGTHYYTAWEGHRRFGYDLVRHMQPNTIVELGTYFGASHFSFCQAVKDHGLSTKSYAVDTWIGDKHSGTYDEDFFSPCNRAQLSFTPAFLICCV